MRGTAWLYRDQLFDATTGTLISKLPARVGGLGVVAGHHLITLAGGANDGHYGRGEVQSSEDFYDKVPVTQVTLADHLTTQFRLATSGPDMVSIGENLIGNVDERGYLMVSDEEAHRTVERGDWYAILPMLPEVCVDRTGSGCLRKEYSSGDNVLDREGTRELLARNRLLVEDLPRRREGELLR